MSDTTFTEAELKAAVDQAVADAITPLQTELTAFRNADAEGAVEAQIAAVRAEADAKVTELQSVMTRTVAAMTSA